MISQIIDFGEAQAGESEYHLFSGGTSPCGGLAEGGVVGVFCGWLRAQ